MSGRLQSRLLPAFALVIFLAGSAGAQAPKTCTLTIVAEGVSNATGVVGILIFRSAEGWPEKPAAAFRKQAVPARPPSTTIAVSGLPPGTYAVVVLHDENENMKLDRNWLGIPKEQWGMSRNPRVRMSAPRFEQAAFQLTADTQIRVTLH